MRTLEDHYRRLLAWYPRDHRAAHEDEMLGVLLAGAEPGQPKPTAGDSADLLWGGLELHARRAFGRPSLPAWRDGLAMACTVGTLIVLVQTVASVALASVADYWVPTRFADLLFAAVVAIGVVANQRWLAAPAAWLLLLNQIPPFGWDNLGSAGPFAIDGWKLLLAGTAVALLLTREPARGLRLAGRRHLLTWAAVLTAGVVWEDLMFWHGQAPDPVFAAVPMVAICAIACGYALRSRTGRRSLAILALPVAYGLTSSGIVLFQISGWLVALLLGLALAPFLRTIGRH